MERAVLPVLGLPPASRGRAAVAALALVGLLYAWPLVDGTVGSAFATADLLLRTAAAVAVSAAATVAALRAPGRTQAALVLLAGGASAWASAHAVRWALATARATGDVPELAVGGALVFCAGATAAVLVLGLDARGAAPLRRTVDLLTTATSVALVAWVLGPGLRPTAPGLLETAGLVLGAALAGAALLGLARAPGGTGGALALPAGLLLVAAACVAVGASGGALPDRVEGVLTCAGLGLVALGVLAVGAPAGPERPRWTHALPSAVVCTAALGGLLALVATVVAGDPLGTVEASLAVVAVLLLLLRQQVLVEGSRRRVRLLAEEEARMRHQAFHDELTGLANRALFLDRLGQSLELHRRHARPLALLFCDLDGFKSVNDAYGHVAGDELLRTIAVRLRGALRPTDTLARLGGDEFAVLLPEDSDTATVARRMQEALGRTLPVADREVVITMSIGEARVGPDEATPSVTDLVARADAAMYTAKRRSAHLSAQAAAAAVRDATTGRPAASSPGPAPAEGTAPAQAAGPSAVDLRLPPATLLRGLPEVSPTARPSAPAGPGADALQQAVALARALQDGDLDVVYQPLVDTATGTVVGLEALARWSPDGVPVPPRDFVALAESAGLATAFTDTVVDRACAQLRAWSVALGHSRLTVAVNITPEQLLLDGLAERAAEAVRRHELAAGQLVLEVTADALSRDPDAAARAGAALREVGVRLSLEEFAEGPVPLSQLQRLPLATLKTSSASTSEDDRLARTLRWIGQELELQVVVAGVERGEQLAALRRVGGLLGQGYLLARPGSADAVEDAVLHGCRLPG